MMLIMLKISLFHLKRAVGAGKVGYSPLPPRRRSNHRFKIKPHLKRTDALTVDVVRSTLLSGPGLSAVVLKERPGRPFALSARLRSLRHPAHAL